MSEQQRVSWTADQRRFIDNLPVTVLIQQANEFSSYPSHCVYRDRHTNSTRYVHQDQAAYIESRKALPALQQAIVASRYSEALMLVQGGMCDVNERGQYGWTALHLVAKAYARYELGPQRRLEMLNTLAGLLIQKGARVDLLDRFELNALASSNGIGPRALREATSSMVAAKAGVMEGYEPYHRMG